VTTERVLYGDGPIGTDYELSAREEIGKWRVVRERSVDPHGNVLRRRTNGSHDRDKVSFHDGNANRGGRDNLGRGGEPVRRTLDQIVADLVERRDKLVGRRVLVSRGPQWFSVHGISSPRERLLQPIVDNRNTVRHEVENQGVI